MRDDGKGLDPEALPLGLGLQSLAARVTETGGTWDLTTAGDGGTVLAVSLPLESLSDVPDEPPAEAESG